MCPHSLILCEPDGTPESGEYPSRAKAHFNFPPVGYILARESYQAESCSLEREPAGPDDMVPIRFGGRGRSSRCRNGYPTSHATE
jgi:hypothetical protein